MELHCIAVEYSVGEKQFFYDTLENIIKRNLNSIKDNVSNDYKIIGICKNFDEAIEYIKTIKKEIAETNKQ